MFYEIVRGFVLAVFALAGWRAEGAKPSADKIVVIAAPHTSNWDLIFMLCVAFHFRIHLKWMGKKSLFSGPFSWAMYALGGIPVDRSTSNNMVSQMVAVYARADRLAVAIPPEATRAKARYWKTGFYNIAHGAKAPIALGFLDYKRKVGGIGAMLTTTGDYDADLEIIKAFYDKVTPKHPERVMVNGASHSA